MSSLQMDPTIPLFSYLQQNISHILTNKWHQSVAAVQSKGGRREKKMFLLMAFFHQSDRLSSLSPLVSLHPTTLREVTT